MDLMPYTGDRSVMAGASMGADALSAGINTASRGIADAVTKQREQVQEAEFLDGKAVQLKQAGALSDEDFAKFKTGSVSAKRGIMSTAIMKFETQQKIAQQKPVVATVPMPDGTKRVVTSSGQQLGSYTADNQPMDKNAQLPALGAAFPVEGGGRLVHTGGGKMTYEAPADPAAPKPPARAGSISTLPSGDEVFWQTDNSAILRPKAAAEPKVGDTKLAQDGTTLIYTGSKSWAKGDKESKDNPYTVAMDNVNRDIAGSLTKIADLKTKIKDGDTHDHWYNNGPSNQQLIDAEEAKIKKSQGTLQQLAAAKKSKGAAVDPTAVSPAAAPTPAPAAAPAAPTFKPRPQGMSDDEILKAARTALQNGKAKAAVQDQLKFYGIDPTRL